MNELSLAQRKRVWTTVLAAFALSVVIYGLLANMMVGTVAASPGGAAMLRPFMYALAGAGVVASIVWYFVKTAQVSPSPAVFQMNTLIALWLAESCSVAGLTLFFMGAPLQELYYFLGASLVVMVFVILPRGLQHWGEIEALEASRGA